MIEVDNITKSFGNLQVLKGISTTINENEIVAIVGASGAGKTTLLQIMGSLDKPDSGKILYNNIDIFSMKEKELSHFRNKNIGFVFQFHQLLPEFNSVENVALPALIGGEKHSEAIKRASELLDYLGLSERLKHKPAQLSGGEKQRVAVARALINKPAVILADEPSGSLDSKNREDLHNLFFKLRDEMGYSIVIVTHDESFAQNANRILHISDGQIINDNDIII